jgi:predicted RND superfamily exporter protein
MDKVAQYLVKKKNLFFFFAFLLICIVPFFISLPKFSGKLNGFNFNGNKFYATALQADSIFGTKNRIYFLVQPLSDNRSEVFTSANAMTREIDSVFPAANIISPVTFYKKMPGLFADNNKSLREFLKQGKGIPLLGELVSKDEKSFLMVMNFRKGGEPDLEKLDKIIGKKRNGIASVRPMSIFHIEKNIEEYIRKDFTKLSIAILLFFLAYYIVVFRKVGAIIYTGVTVGISIFASLFFFSLLDYNITIVSVLVIPVVLILALSDSLHLMSGYVSFAAIEDKTERLKKMVNHYIIPSFFSSATTAAAFFTFYFFNDSTFIREFGLVTGFTLVTEFFLTFMISPFILFHLDIKKIHEKKVLAVSRFFERKRKYFAIAFIFIFISSFFIIPQLKFQTNTEIFFPSGSEIQRTHEEFKRQFYSTINAEILISAKNKIVNANESTSVKNPVEEYVRGLTKKLRESKSVVGVTSATDTFFLKTDLGMAVDIFSVLGDHNPYYDSKRNMYRVEIRFQSADTMFSFCQKTLPALLKETPSEIKVEYTSPTLIMDHVNHSVSSSLISSLLTSGISIVLIILLLTRSISLSIMSMLPNLIPLAMVGVLYVVCGMNINILNAITAVVCLGLLDDDTVHILYRRLWLNEPLQELSFSILSTAFLLAGGFGLFLLSSFEPTRVFGWVSALVFVLGVICEITLMQWIIEGWKKMKGKIQKTK